jgi:hypothetical protein
MPLYSFPRPQSCLEPITLGNVQRFRREFMARHPWSIDDFVKGGEGNQEVGWHAGESDVMSGAELIKDRL